MNKKRIQNVKIVIFILIVLVLAIWIVIDSMEQINIATKRINGKLMILFSIQKSLEFVVGLIFKVFGCILNVFRVDLEFILKRIEKGNNTLNKKLVN